MKQPIPTRVHGVLDYLSVITLFVLPRMLNWGLHVTNLLTLLAILTLLYSLVTRYELSLARVLPVPAHLALDFLSGLLLIAAPYVLLREPQQVTYALIGFGIFEIVVSLLTQHRSSVETHTPQGTALPQP